MTDAVIDLLVSLDPDEGDDEELDELTSQLRRELLELDVQSVERPSRAAPPGTRSAGALAIGELIVHAATAPALVTAVVAVVQGWLRRAGRRSARIEVNGKVLDVKGISAADQHEVIAAFVADVLAGAAPPCQPGPRQQRHSRSGKLGRAGVLAHLPHDRDRVYVNMYGKTVTIMESWSEL